MGRDERSTCCAIQCEMHRVLGIGGHCSTGETRGRLQSRQVRERTFYSITSSARASSEGGNCETDSLGGLEIDPQFVLRRRLPLAGLSRTFSPLRIRSTYSRRSAETGSTPIRPIRTSSRHGDEETLRVDRRQPVPAASLVISSRCPTAVALRRYNKGQTVWRTARKVSDAALMFARIRAASARSIIASDAVRLMRK
jgi:hypothetical protein